MVYFVLFVILINFQCVLTEERGTVMMYNA